MKVRGPALAKCGMPATMKGLNEQQAMEHFEYGEDDRTYGIMDAQTPASNALDESRATRGRGPHLGRTLVIVVGRRHNRIVQLMAAQDPSKIPNARDMAGRKNKLLSAKVDEKGDLSVSLEEEVAPGRRAPRTPDLG